MKEFLTEWLICFGTGPVALHLGGAREDYIRDNPIMHHVVDKEFIVDIAPEPHCPYTYQITPKGLEYLKDDT